jgi:tetratricopeptide (TPR) repeat protein
MVVALASGVAAGATRDVVLAEDPSGTQLGRASLSACLKSSVLRSRGERAALLERGLADAEKAIASHEQDAKAHFAVFCNLGRKLQNEGASLTAVSEIERMKREIDRALALEPNFVDALAAKGAMLIQLPGLMGGDEEEGEKLIRRAVDLAPDHPAARLELAKALAKKGDDNNALEEARQVVVLAQSHSSPAALREARELADEIGS